MVDNKDDDLKTPGENREDILTTSPFSTPQQKLSESRDSRQSQQPDYLDIADLLGPPSAAPTKKQKGNSARFFGKAKDAAPLTTS